MATEKINENVTATGEGNDTVDSAVDENDARAAFESLQPTLAGMDEQTLIPLRYGATESVVRGLWLADNAKRDIAKFEATYTNPPMEEINTLRQRALAVKGAELAEEPEDSLTPPDVEKTRMLRTKFIMVERAVFNADEEKQQELDDIETGAGHRDLGSDGIRLADIADQHWLDISPTGLVEKAEIGELRNCSVNLLRWAGRREGKSENMSRKMEQRAWSYMAEAYNKVRDLAYAVYIDDKTAWERDYPSLYAEKPPK